MGPAAACLDYDSLGPRDLDEARLREVLPEIVLHGSTSPEELPGRLAGLRIALINKVSLDRAAMEAAPELRFIGVSATGTDNVDLEAARERGIAVCNVRDYGTASVTQHVFALILALNQHLLEYRTLVLDGTWASGGMFCRLDHPIRELSGLALGIVGYGNLGRAVAAVARGFGMRILAARREGIDHPPEADVERLPLPRLLERSDIVSLHCPLTPATEGMIDAQALLLMRRDALLINTARGALVDSDALLDALERGHIAGAGIDVLAEEPPVSGDPLLAAQRPNLIVTPHIAWTATAARQRLVDETAENVAAWLAGGHRNRVV